MKLRFSEFDGRRHNTVDVIDETTRNVVGFIQSTVGSGIRISLFDGKYQGDVDSYEQCVGFVRGVQAVLNRLVSTNDGRTGMLTKISNLEMRLQEQHTLLKNSERRLK